MQLLDQSRMANWRFVAGDMGRGKGLLAWLGSRLAFVGSSLAG
jgi:hypothetical protein